MIAAQSIGLIAAMLSATACSRQPVPTYATLLDVEAHQQDWNSATILVDGWINGCGGYDCSMFASMRDAQFDWQHIRPGAKLPVILGIASARPGSAGMDVQLNQLGLRHILLKARVDAECAGHRCLDRSPDLHPLAFRVLPSSPNDRN